MKVRVKFTKGEQLKFIGHLDVMRLFQRAIKRANLPIGYSTGFNPHQLLAFANPLSLGMTSGGEYGDFEMAMDIAPQLIVEKLKNEMPDGIEILDAVLLEPGAEKAMASVKAASYEVTLPEEITPWMMENILPTFLAQNEILVMKKTKHHLKETDIRPDIFQMENCSSQQETKLYLLLAAGSDRSLKAELVVKSLYDKMGLEFNRFKIQYKRCDLFQNKDEELIPLGGK